MAKFTLPTVPTPAVTNDKDGKEADTHEEGLRCREVLRSSSDDTAEVSGAEPTPNGACRYR